MAGGGVGLHGSDSFFLRFQLFALSAWQHGGGGGKLLVAAVSVVGVELTGINELIFEAFVVLKLALGKKLQSEPAEDVVDNGLGDRNVLVVGVAGRLKPFVTKLLD